MKTYYNELDLLDVYVQKYADGFWCNSVEFVELVDEKNQKNYELVVVGIYRNKIYKKRLQEHILNKILGKKHIDFKQMKGCEGYSLYPQNLLLKNL